MDNKFKEYVPIKDNICKEFIRLVKLYTIKFHGKIKPLKNSVIAKTNEKIKIDEKFLSSLNFKSAEVAIP